MIRGVYFSFCTPNQGGTVSYFCIIAAEYTLVKQGTDIVDCNGQKILIGNWGGADRDTKLKLCANMVMANSSCGDSFFFRPDKGRCFCEGLGATCQREADPLIFEYILGNG